MTRAKTAMVLAAGHGERMRPLTDKIPKPMVKLAGRPLIDHVLDRLDGSSCRDGGRQRALPRRPDRGASSIPTSKQPEIVISDERDLLLDTGGGAKKALPLLGDGPFFIYNSDSVWSEGVTPALNAMLRQWDPERHGLSAAARAACFQPGIFRQRRFQHDAGRQAGAQRRASGGALYLRRRVALRPTPVRDCAGRAVLAEPFVGPIASSGTIVRDPDSTGRWMHVGTPEALNEAEIWFEREGA